MKKLIWGLLIFGVITQLPTFGQSDWQVKAFAGVSDAAFLGNILDGSPSVSVDRLQEYGVRLSWQGKSKWGFETGLTYTMAKLQIGTMWIPSGNPPPRPANLITYSEKSFEYIGVPLLVTYELSSFFSLQAGPLLGLQQSDSSNWMEQSGIGYLVGVNLHHYFDRLGVFLQPNFKQHAALGFNQRNIRLTELGLQIGVAYKLSSL